MYAKIKQHNYPKYFSKFSKNSNLKIFVFMFKKCLDVCVPLHLSKGKSPVSLKYICVFIFYLCKSYVFYLFLKNMFLHFQLLDQRNWEENKKKVTLKHSYFSNKHIYFFILCILEMIYWLLFYIYFVINIFIINSFKDEFFILVL